MSAEQNIGHLDRRKFFKAHQDSMYVQSLFTFPHEQIRPETFAFDPCWGILDPGMTMAAHEHNTPEFYVFTQGIGEMTLADETFTVEPGMAVNIPPNVRHTVTNPEHAASPLIWVTVGFPPAAE